MFFFVSFTDLAGFKLAHNYWPFSSFNKMSMVTDAMKHALTAEHPKARYLCGYDARLYVIVTTFLPDWFLDIIVRIVSSYNKVRSKV